MTMITLHPKVFFFDFDGVIFNSEEQHRLAILDVLVPYEISMSKSAYLEKYFYLNDKLLFDTILTEHEIPHSKNKIAAFVEKKHEAFMAIMTNPKQIVYSGVKELMNCLRKKSIPMAVVTGSLTSEVTSFLEQTDLMPFIDFILGADQVLHGKPHPESYQTAFFMMKKKQPSLQTSEIVVLEDSPASLKAAHDLGMQTIGITNSVAAANFVNADHIINDICEIQIA